MAGSDGPLGVWWAPVQRQATMTRVAVSGCFLAVAMLLTSSVSAESGEDRVSGASIGLRTGWALPMAALEKNDPMKSNFTGMLPLWFDAGYRWNSTLYTGAYFQWAPLFVASDWCSKNLQCSATDVRFGIDAHWHFKGLINGGDWAGPFDPWIGLGTGYESAVLQMETSLGATSHETHHGFEYANFQLGGDVVTGPLHVGAFMTLALAEYSRVSHTTPLGTEGFAVSDPAVHLWLFLGIRGQFDL
jgi:hypothetical protein